MFVESLQNMLEFVTRLEGAQEVPFEMVLPEEAFISNFTIETGGKTYVSRVEKKEDAKKIYNKEAMSGQTAGLVQRYIW